MSDMFLSIVVPCYNEEAVLDELVARLGTVCTDLKIPSYEIVLIDDGSQDGTARMIRAAHAADPRITGVFLSRNHGHQLALTAGLHVCRGERVLIIDADLQDPPELLGAMLEKLEDGAEVVYGKRISRAGETLFKKVTAKLFYRFFRSMVDLDMPLDTGDFRLMSRKALDVLLQMPEQHRFIRGMVSWIGFEQTAVEYERAERFAGETKYPLKKMLVFAADAITGFSVVPLRLATWLGFICAMFTLPVAGYVLLGYLRGTTVPGWASVMMVVLVLGSIQLIVTGILGEYMGRLYMQSKNRPLFVIDEVLRDEEVSAEVVPVAKQRRRSASAPQSLQKARGKAKAQHDKKTG